MADNKTKPTGTSVAAFLDALTERRRTDAKALIKIMSKVTGEKATLWGPSIIGVPVVRYVLIVLLLAATPLTTRAGALAREFGSGYEGVAWGDSLEDLVKMHPGGDHFFAFGDGVRDYALLDERPIFGIPRNRMRARYFLDDTNSVVSVGLTFPYDQRQKLLGALVLSYGPYKRTATKGIRATYSWARDDGVSLSVVETFDPSFGILVLNISGPNIDLQKRDPCICPNQSVNASKK
jgi:hypothetical protein